MLSFAKDQQHDIWLIDWQNQCNIERCAAYDRHLSPWILPPI